ncbi:hypothetical protein ACQEWB_31960 [Streptomyces sp. CA-249302]|uniref:hypothetical protein n=1 Tax=Streptomyces sp. CA-249302 TaxID=3240058 RepID=UPI003D89D4FF
MAVRISVSVKGPTGLDDTDRMLGELKEAADLPWHVREVEEDGALGSGIVEIVLVAVVGKTVEIGVSAAVDAVKQAVERWRSERLDPPDVTVGTESVPDAETGSADPEGSDG